MAHFTLHVRMTKKCNADCSYCSSWQENPLSYMKLESFKSSVDFIIDKLLPLYGYSYDRNNTVTIQYVGGEIATVPKKILYNSVFYARDRFSELFGEVYDTVQSNLITSERKVMQLANLFGGALGTSVDTYGSQRTVAGSADKYRDILNNNLNFLKSYRKINPGRVFVVDKEGAEFALKEYQHAVEGNYNLVLRPVFYGGRGVQAAESDIDSKVFGEVFDKWIMQSNISVEPFHQLLVERLSDYRASETVKYHYGCPFQSDCAEVSINLEPDGEIFVCYDMADSGQYSLGNAVTGEFKKDVWEMLLTRSEKLHGDCKSCKWVNACHGGCMSEAIHLTGSPFGKTPHCGLWQTIFKRIDTAIAYYGADNIISWSNKLGSE